MTGPLKVSGSNRKRRASLGQSAVFPVSPAQYLCLARDEDPNCRDDTRGRWVLASATLVQPKVDLRRLQRAVDKLVARHDSLRTRFDKAGDRFQAVIDPHRTSPIREVELGPLDHGAFLARIKEIANAPLPVRGKTLAEVIVVHAADRGDVVIWRAHHAITDGYGMVVLFEDMMKLLLGLPIATKALSYGEYVSRFLSVSPDRTARIEAFWSEMHRDLPHAPNIGRKRKGLEPLWFNLGDVVGKRRLISVSSDSLNSLSNRATGANLSPTNMLFTGFLETLCQLYDTDRLAFTTLIARSDPGMNTFAGAHYFDPILPYHMAGIGGIDETAQRLRRNLMLASEHLPSDAASQATNYEKALVAADIYPRQFSVHQPRPTGRIKKSPFSRGFTSKPGTPLCMGPYTLTQLEISDYRRCRTDLRFMLREEQENPGFYLEYDGLSYDDAEISAMSVRIAEILNLEITQDKLLA